MQVDGTKEQHVILTSYVSYIYSISGIERIMMRLKSCFLIPSDNSGRKRQEIAHSIRPRNSEVVDGRHRPPRPSSRVAVA